MDDLYLLRSIKSKEYNHLLPKLQVSKSVNNSLEKSINISQDDFEQLIQQRTNIIKNINKFTQSSNFSHLIQLQEQFDKKLRGTKNYSLYIQTIRQMNIFNSLLLSKIEQQKNHFNELKYFYQSLRDFKLRIVKRTYQKKKSLTKRFIKYQYLKLSDTIRIQNKYSCLNSKLIEDDKKVKMKTINNIKLENCALQMSIVQLASKFKQVDLDSDISVLFQYIKTLQNNNKKLQQEIQQQNVTHQKETFEQNQHVFNLNQKCESLIKTNKRLRLECEAPQQASELLASKEEAFQSKIKVLNLNILKFAQEKMNTMQETIQMQWEDIRGKSIKYYEDKVLADKAQSKYQKLQREFDKSIFAQHRMKVDRTKEVDIPEYWEYKEQLKQIGDMAQYFKKDPVYYIPKLPQVKENCEDQFHKEDTEQNQDYNFQYELPPHMIFLEHHNKTIQDEIQVIEYRRINPQFFLQLRHIMDSYWNHILLHQDNLQKISRMAEFTYDWINNFSINVQTRNIEELSSTDRSNPGKKYLRFILDVQNPDFLRVWEIQQYKNLLEDKYTRDEEYFFFYYRFIVFRGQLMHRDNPQCTTQLIPIIYGELVIEMVMKKYDNNTIQQAKNGLQRYKKIVRRSNDYIYLVNGWWVMAILMQFYETEKKHRFRWIQKQFAASMFLQKPTKRGVSFAVFTIIMNKAFPDTSPLIIAQLYRQSYALKPGSLQKILWQQQQNLTFQQHNSLYSNIHILSLSPQKDNLQIIKDFLKVNQFKFEKLFEVMKDQLYSIGSSHVLQEINRIRQLLSLDLKEFSLINLPFQLHSILYTLEKVRQLKSFHEILINNNDPTLFIMNKIQSFLQNSDNQESIRVLFPSYGEATFLSMEQMVNQMAKIQEVGESLNNFKQNQEDRSLKKIYSISKLQRLVRRKIIKFYTQIFGVMSKNLQKQKQSQESLANINQIVKKSVMFNSLQAKRISALQIRRDSPSPLMLGAPRKSSIQRKS